jgi:hypothetical protein
VTPESQALDAQCRALSAGALIVAGAKTEAEANERLRAAQATRDAWHPLRQFQVAAQKLGASIVVSARPLVHPRSVLVPIPPEPTEPGE